MNKTPWTPYATTATQFFEQHAPVLLADPAIAAAGGKVEFQIEGTGTWTIDFAKRTINRGEASGTVQAIIKANDGDFMALLEGRMTPADGFLTQRLRVAGEVATIGRLMAAVTPAGRAQ
jgi:putative sterol carrier protein